MEKTKRNLLYILSAVFMSAIIFITINNLSADSYAKIISPYESGQIFDLSVSNSNGDLLMSTTGGLGTNTYQYWIKERVETDKMESNLINEQYIWQLVRGYNSSVIATLQNAGANYVDNNGKYNIIVRIKDGSGKIIDELYRSFTSTDIKEVCITNIEINGKAVYNDYVVVNKSAPLDIKVNGNLEGLTYALYYGKALIGNSSTSGIFASTSIDSFSDGLHIITVKATNTSSIAVKNISLYVYDNYIAQDRPVITSLMGESDVNGVTEFVMKVKYADGSVISNLDKDKFKYTLTSGNRNCTLVRKTVNALDGTLDINFNIYYGSGNYGIYYTVGQVSRSAINGCDDKIIRYYAGYAERETTLMQTSTATLTDGVYYSILDSSITITGEGSIAGASNVTYAFYREDASGWVLIRNYSSSSDFVWIPARAGIYNIQARIKDTAAGSYEKSVTKTYKIAREMEVGTLGLKIYDYETGNERTNSFITGKPYKIEALYSITENVLYMFTLTSQNLGTVYLNNFTTSPYLIFIPSRPDTYIITARAISIDNFGYKDISLKRTIQAVISSEDATLSDLTVDSSTVAGFSPSVQNYEISLAYGTTQTPAVNATKNYPNATEVVTPATDVTSANQADRTTTVVVTAEDGITIKTYTIVFLVGSAAPIDLGTAGDFTILSEAGISATASTSIIGDIGVSPVAGTYITGFGLTLDSTGVFSTSSLVSGKIYAASYIAPSPSNLTIAIGDMHTAYNNAAGRAVDFTELYNGDISGKTLTAGVYKWSTDVLINSELTINGGANDIWIFQIAGKLTQASDIKIILTGGAQAKNIFWQVANNVVIGMGAHFEGNILGKINIALMANASINGRLLAQVAVTLDANSVYLQM